MTWLEVKRLEGLLNPGGKKKKKKNIFQYRQLRGKSGPNQ